MAKYEEKIVLYLLQHFGLGHHKTEMKRILHEKTGHFNLSLAHFHSFFSSFPIYLFASDAPYLLENMDLPALFKNFAMKSLMERYEECCDPDNEVLPGEYHDAPVGLIFPCLKVARGLILHDATVDITEPVEGYKKNNVRIVGTLRGRKLARAGVQYYTIEPLAQFLSSLDWTYDEQEMV